MEPKSLYTAADCTNINRDFSPEGMVIVIEKNALPVDYSNQLFFCTHDDSHKPHFCRPVSTVSLSDGEKIGTPSSWKNRIG